MYVSSNPQPIRNDIYVDEANDWRTEHRILMYNRIANRLFLRLNVPIIKTFDILLPFVESLCDNAHYMAKDVLLPILQQAVYRLKCCRCSDL